VPFVQFVRISEQTAASFPLGAFEKLLITTVNFTSICPNGTNRMFWVLFENRLRKFWEEWRILYLKANIRARPWRADFFNLKFKIAIATGFTQTCALSLYSPFWAIIDNHLLTSYKGLKRLIVRDVARSLCVQSLIYQPQCQSHIHFLSYLAHFFLDREIFQTKVVEKVKTHILCSIRFYRNSCRLWDNVENYNRAREATDDNMAHAHCKLDT